MSITETKLAQDLDAAVAAYQRQFGRPATLQRLQHMLDRAEAAQRVMEDATDRMGSSTRKAAE